MTNCDTYFNEYNIPGTTNCIWFVSAPGKTLTNSVNKAKQPCRVLTDFSCISLYVDLMIELTWP